MNAKHTPGPWKAVRGNYGERKDVDTIQAGNLKVIEPGGIGGRSLAECDANVALIAAAPELLAALQAIVQDCREVLAGREPMSMELIHSIANGKARAAIAKATGTA
jgi:hypothetical protein